MQKNIGKILKVPLRNLWKKEDKDFTKWMEENIDYLNDILDFEISIESSEENVGPFRVDLYGEDGFGRKVIIENQLEKSDHDHLGKLLTYLINLEAKIAIWISSDPVEEHSAVIDWLNEVAPDDMLFYLIKIEAIEIEGQSMAAPLFTIVKGPTAEAKQLGSERKEFAQRHIVRKQFWEQLLERSKNKTKLFSNISPSMDHWLSTGIGKSGIALSYLITNKYAGCDLYFSRGRNKADDENVNKIWFDELYKNKDRIEKEFGAPLDWQRLNDKWASRIACHYQGLTLQDEKNWPMIQDKLIETAIRMEKVFAPFIKQLE
ncbi:MAG: DUF4268 domain-containing protein [Candidatus Omnitrophica bacterium]|nr:DUF4268 domain-containing protein [Candidatus Omnitrophota bacterium]